MFRMDKTAGKGMTHAEVQKNKLFSPDTSVSQRLAEAWYLTCMAYGLDPANPPGMDKTFGKAKKREDHGQCF